MTSYTSRISWRPDPPGGSWELQGHNHPATDPSRDQAGVRFAILAGLSAALLLTVVSSIRLGAQGLEYDELHQAPAAFAYVGRESWMFTRVRIAGVPVLTMSYSGAIKPALYGLYMRMTGADFGVVSWRLTGIAVVAAGIVCFCVISRRAWTRFGLGLFLALLVSDSALLLLTRFDWGAVALAFMFRLLMLAVWLRGAAAGRVGWQSMFGLGVLLGIAVFEKLVAIVLILPLLLLVRLGWGRLSFGHWAAAVAGGAFGGLPLLIANVYSYVHSGMFISLADVTPARPLPRLPVTRFLREYVGLGQGVPPRTLMLGAGPADGIVDQSLLAIAEGAILSGLLLAVLLVARKCEHRSAVFKWAGALVLAYVAIAIGLLLMPRATLMHHWLVGTPFQYAALALSLGGCATCPRGDVGAERLRSMLLGGMGALIVLRVMALVSLVVLLGAGRASIRWDPSFTKLGMFAAEHADSSVFVAADWGVATPIYCLGNGRPGLVLEEHWRYEGPGRMERAIAATGKRTLYVVTMRPISTIAPETARRILGDVQASPRWMAVPVEPAVADLRAVRVWKFVRQSDER